MSEEKIETVELNLTSLRGNIIDILRLEGYKVSKYLITSIYIVGIKYKKKDNDENIRENKDQFTPKMGTCDDVKSWIFEDIRIIAGFIKTYQIKGYVKIATIEKIRSMYEKYNGMIGSVHGDYDFSESDKNVCGITLSVTLYPKKLAKDLHKSEELEKVYDYVKESNKRQYDSHTACVNCGANCSSTCVDSCMTSCISNTCAQNCQTHGCQGECDEWCGFGCINGCGSECSKTCDSSAWISHMNNSNCY